ncbi:MAG: hypothetical protein E6K53_00370 [Gammaproteobacteria bacterium]|nr:MAG: hypothetical protein E6K53_00370 [Gammaproteobacteria bacterium]
MQFVNRLLALGRDFQISRQPGIIERAVASLSLANRVRLESLVQNEMARAGWCAYPAANDTAQNDTQWEEAIETGFTRAQSDNMEVRLRGIALWLAAVLHETRASTHENMEPRRRTALRIVRELKESVPRRRVSNAVA